MPEDKSIADCLHELFTERFGDDWRRDISLTLRADTLYWFVFLAERGIAAKRQDLLGDLKSTESGVAASAAASLASWTIDLEELLNKIRNTFPPKKGCKASGK